jgi:predicted lipid-binding transport protein (Tim44 family)
MGGLLAIVFALGETLPPAEPATSGPLLGILVVGFFAGSLYGAALGFLEGLILGVPPAALLIRFRG